MSKDPSIEPVRATWRSLLHLTPDLCTLRVQANAAPPNVAQAREWIAAWQLKHTEKVGLARHEPTSTGIGLGWL